MTGASQRHIREATLVGMQPTAILLDLRQIQSVRINTFHVIDAHIPQGAEHFVVNDFRILQHFQRFQRISTHKRVMGESRQNIGVHTHRNRHRSRIGQPRFGGLMIFGRRPHTILETVETLFINDHTQIAALVGGESAIGHADHGHGIPFKALRLVHGHQHHVDRHIGSHRVLLVCVAQRIRP